MVKKYLIKVFAKIAKIKDFAKIAGKKVLHKSAEATGEMTGNKVADRITRCSRNKVQKKMIK